MPDYSEIKKALAGQVDVEGSFGRFNPKVAVAIGMGEGDPPRKAQPELSLARSASGCSRMSRSWESPMPSTVRLGAVQVLGSPWSNGR